MLSTSALRDRVYTGSEYELAYNCRVGERAASLMAKSCGDRERRHYCKEIRKAFLLVQACIESGEHFQRELLQVLDAIDTLAEFVPPVQ